MKNTKKTPLNTPIKKHQTHIVFKKTLKHRKHCFFYIYKKVYIYIHTKNHVKNIKNHQTPFKKSLKKTHNTLKTHTFLFIKKNKYTKNH